jgi:hypothetical protein
VLDAIRRPEVPGGGRALLLALGLGSYYLSLLMLSGLGFARGRRDPALRVLFLAFPVGITAVSMWFHLESRYVLPAFPIVVLGAAHALSPLLGGPDPRREPIGEGERSPWKRAPAAPDPSRRPPVGVLGS